MDTGSAGGGGSGGPGGGGGEPKVKRKMKTASQLEILEKTYAVETYPSETLRAELSVQLGLSDRQLQMWFCHRRLKDRKAPPVKRAKKDASDSPAPGAGDEMVLVERGNELGGSGGSGSASSPFAHLERVATATAPPPRPGSGTAVARIAVPEMPMPTMKRYYEPPQAVSELRAISFVEAQLGEPMREDGPILGMEFDPLPPGAFGAPLTHSKPPVRPYEAKVYERPDAKVYERPDAKLLKGGARALPEYLFLPEQPSVKTETYERSMSAQYYGSPSNVVASRTPISTRHALTHANEQVSSAYGYQGQTPILSLLPQQGRQSHLLPPASGDYDIVPRKNLTVSTGMDVPFAAHPITALDNPFVPSDKRVTQEEEISCMERKRKNEEARIAREVEAHEKRIRKELEKQDIMRRKREEQMRKEMERQDRERRKEEEKLLREKQREEERYQREQRREMERREKFLQKESIRAEKLRLKEEMRREKEAARLKAANDRAAARRIAKESMELIDDEHLELMELAASRNGLPSMLSLDSETLESLETLRDMLIEFPPKSVRLKRPFKIQPWTDSEENVGNLLMVWRFLITFADVLGLWPFTLDEFVQALHDYDPRLLGEIHVALLKSIIKDIEDVARTPSTGLGATQASAANPGGGHPQIVEGAFAWGFDIRSWQRNLNPLTWPEILRQFALTAGYGPKLKKQNVEQVHPRDENEDIDSGDIISNLRNGAAAENALAIMQERCFFNLRRSRHRLTPGTVKYAAFHILSLEGSKGLSILDVAEKIQKSGLRDLTTSKTPEASIAAALSRDTKLFERTAPSTYCVRAPYRKDPADGEAILSAAKEKIQIFKNGYFDGEEADAVERDDAEKDEDSESDVAEEPEVDDIDMETKLNEEALLSSGTDGFLEKPPKRSEIGVSSVELMETSHGDIGDSAGHLIKEENLGEAKVIGVSVNQSNDIAGLQKGEVDDQETVIDESNSGEPWVQGLMEGDYSDLSVEERLNAIVALISIANEGNSIRVVLEERLEAANALKKQLWAEAQVDKRRMKEDFVMKMQYSSFGNRAEQALPVSVSEGRQSPLHVLNEKIDSTSINPSVYPEHLGDPRSELNHANEMPSERNLAMQEFAAGTDSIQLQQLGYVGEKSRSQLKAFIGHKAEEMYVYRSLPIGQDRRRNRYWQFITSASRNDPGSGRIFVELRDGRWRLIDCEEGFNGLIASLDVRGFRESNLHSMLQRIEIPFKEAVKKNSFCITSQLQAEYTISTEVSEMAERSDFSTKIDSPNSTICVPNSDISSSSSSFAIGLGRNDAEKSEALKRYEDFEKWMWAECFSNSALCALKIGKTRCKQLLGICEKCRNLFSFEASCCPFCHRPYEAFVSDINFSEHISPFKVKHKQEDHLFCGDSSPPLRLRLLKAQLAMIEACIPVEALKPFWVYDYRKSWGMMLLNTRSAEVLLQVLTILEGAIKRDFLSSNFETTYELLGSHDPKIDVFTASSSCETVSVLPWLPQTTSSVALRLMELDASIYYNLDQKEDAEKNKGAGDFLMFPPRYNVPKNVVEGELAESSPYEAGNQQQDSWVGDSGFGRLGSGRGRDRGRGRGRTTTRGGGRRSQRRVIPNNRTPPLNTDINRVDQLEGWKGRRRGRAGRRRGRCTTRSRQKPVKRASSLQDEVDEIENNHKDFNFEETTTPLLENYDFEEPSQLQAGSPENASSSERSEYENEHDNEQGSGYDYDDDLLVGGYSNVFNEQTAPFMDEGGEYDLEGEEEEEEDDDINYVDDEDGDVDVDGFFNGDSDENPEDNDTGGGGQIGNTDDITDSSSGYSD